MSQLIEKIVKISDDALSLVASKDAHVLFGDNHEQVQKNIQKIAWRSRKIQRSADHNAAISVYGPSQAGKSFLASVLVRPTDKPLQIEFPGQSGSKEYISEINPSGDRECTGLVTRFTISSKHKNADFPIQLKLLSELDIICILINSYFSDGEHRFENHKSIAELKEYFESIQEKNKPSTNSISKEDFWEIEEYLKENFSSSNYANTLISFLEVISDRAVETDVLSKAQFYAPFWGFHEQFTNLFIRMMEALETVQYSTELFASEPALIPKTTSIIDVQTLKGVTSDDDETIDVQCPSGEICKLTRSLLSAITSELILDISDVPHNFMNHTDVLDFPGARNREPINLSDYFAAFEDEGNKIHEFLIRGKVAYLFQKYVNAQDINAMLLCIKHSNMEAVGLTNVIDRWITNSIGKNAESRTGQNNSFFFVMTFFDQHLVDTAANENEDDRFTRRIGSSLLEKFGKLPDSWPLSWSLSANKHIPFNNCYWLRNPGVAQSYFTRKNGIEEFTSTPVENKRISQIQDMHMNTKEVINHFRNPDAAWKAVMRENDGGVSYILSELSKVCKPEIKNEQLENLANSFSKDLTKSLVDYYVPSDITERKAVLEEKIRKLKGEIDSISKENRFANFLEEFYTSEDRLCIWAKDNTSTHVSEVLRGVCDDWHTMAKTRSKEIEKKFPISKSSVEFIIEQMVNAFKVSKIEKEIIQKAEFLDGMERNRKSLALNLAALVLNDFISKTERMDEQDSRSINLNAVRENVAREFSSRWLLNFQNIAEKNMYNLDGAIVNSQMNENVGNILNGLKLSK
ncbi:putative virulence factor [Planktomarina temperata]|nr:putative virulence factor [Planktomarina temperata]